MRKIYFRLGSKSTSDNSKHRLRLFSMLWVLSFLLVTSSVSAQTTHINGKVTDANGNALTGVSVIVKDGTSGVTSDVAGMYELNVPKGAVLQFRFIGFIDQDQDTKDKTTINVVLKEDSQEIDEVVVVGYGTQRKRDMTGAIASVSSEKIKERSYSNVMQSLAGQLPGVQITQSSGAPGMAPTIRIRGASSINAGTSPLYVIDGIPIEDATKSSGENGAKDLNYNQNPLNNINPNDIESVEVLKDASSAAIYGSRGANGVVLITTKQGKAGKTKVEASYEFGVSDVARRVDMMNAPEFMDYTRHTRNNTWASDKAGNSINDPNSVRPLKYQVPVEFSDPAWIDRIGNGTDWQDILFRTAFTHNVQASVSGGTEKTQFMISGGYLDSEGVVDNSYYDRMNLRSNLKHKISDKFEVGVNLSLARSKSQMFGASGKSDAVSFALQSDPLFPVYNENGNYSHRDPNSIWNTFQKYSFQLWHPYAFTRESTNEKIVNNTLAVGYIDYHIIDGLTFRTSISANIDDQHYSDYRNKGQKYGHEQYREAEANSNSQQMFNWTWENTLNYNKTFGDHAVTGLVGYTAQKQRIDNSNMLAATFPNDLVHTINAGKVSNGATTAAEWSLLSYLARATYAYQGKYLLSAAVRADGCSRFGSNNRWGYFPSASIGWRMSEESFMQNASTWLDNLKLRVSYGVTGNNQIPNYGSIGLLGYSNYVFAGNISSGMYTNSFPDRNLKWEKTGQVNIGFDASFLNQRINVSYDYYYSKTKDLLLNVPIPVLTGFTSSLTNVGELQNQGMELSISSRNLVGQFSWTTDFNISGNRNKVLKLGNNDAPIPMGNNNCNIMVEVGQPLGNYYGYIIDGVIMSEADLTKYPVFKGSEAGDPKVRDVKGPNGSGPDNIVDANDRTIIGNYQPDFTWGMTNTFMYKGFDLSVMLTGSQGGEIMNQQARFTKIGRANRGVYKSVNNFWRSEENPGDGINFKPRLEETTVQNQCSTYWIEDGSYVRIKNIRLGYTIPNKLTNKLGIASAKVYVNVENVHIFSDYINYDPEASSFQNGIYAGFDYGAYPNPRVFTMGINFNF